MSPTQSIYALIAVIIASMLGLAWLQLHHAPPHSQHWAADDNQGAQPKKEKSKTAPVVGNQDAAPHAKAGSAETTTEKEKAEDAIARYTLWLTIFTGVLAASTIGLWLATYGLYRATKQEFISTQRPYVFVSEVKHLHNAADPHVRYEVANYGRMPAIIEAFGASFGKTPDMPTYNVEDDHPLRVRPVIGERDFVQDIPEALPLGYRGGDISIIVGIQSGGSEERVEPSLKEGEQLYFRVIVNYSGPFSVGHSTSACWVYDQTLSQFKQHGGKAYNYNK